MKQAFLNIKFNEPLPNPIHTMLNLNFKFRSQFKLMPQIRSLIAFTGDSITYCTKNEVFH